MFWRSVPQRGALAGEVVEFSDCLEFGFQEDTASGFPRRLKVLAEIMHT